MKLCPILNKEIEDDICFLTATVAEGITPHADGEPQIINSPEFPQACLHCKNHPN